MKKLKFIGVGGAMNLELGGNCCYLKDGDNLLVIDACEDATKKLVEEDAFKGVKNIYIAITHTHYDHVAGLGILIWYANFVYKIKPTIIYKTFRYKCNLKKLLKITGVNKKHFNLIKDSDFNMDGLTIEFKKTMHAPELQCFGFMFSDNKGKYYYTGDSNDVKYVRELCNDDSVKTIYCEVATETFDVHIKYDDIKDLSKDKLVLMHVNTMDLYNQIKKDGFSVGL